MLRPAGHPDCTAEWISIGANLRAAPDAVNIVSDFVFSDELQVPVTDFERQLGIVRGSATESEDLAGCTALKIVAPRLAPTNWLATGASRLALNKALTDHFGSDPIFFAPTQLDLLAVASDEAEEVLAENYRSATGFAATASTRTAIPARILRACTWSVQTFLRSNHRLVPEPLCITTSGELQAAVVAESRKITKVEPNGFAIAA